MKLGFIGFGEATYNICHGLRNDQNVSSQISAYDVMALKDIQGQKIREKMNELNVKLCSDLKELSKESDLIFCATSAKYAVNIAKDVSPYLDKTKTYIDLNSASPKIKIEVGHQIKAVGSNFIDGAVMAPVPSNKHRVPIYVSGATAQNLANQLNAMGMNLTFIDEVEGKSSAIKMIRSIFMKGFTAVLLETLIASNKFQIEDEIFNSINETLHEKTIEELAQLLIPRTAVHAERRITEMEEVVSMLNEETVDSIMALATKNKLQYILDFNFKKEFENQVPESYLDIANHINFQKN